MLKTHGRSLLGFVILVVVVTTAGVVANWAIQRNVRNTALAKAAAVAKLSDAKTATIAKATDTNSANIAHDSVLLAQICNLQRSQTLALKAYINGSETDSRVLANQLDGVPSMELKIHQYLNNEQINDKSFRDKFGRSLGLCTPPLPKASPVLKVIQSPTASPP